MTNRFNKHVNRWQWREKNNPADLLQAEYDGSQQTMCACVCACVWEHLTLSTGTALYKHHSTMTWVTMARKTARDTTEKHVKTNNEDEQWKKAIKKVLMRSMTFSNTHCNIRHKKKPAQNPTLVQDHTRPSFHRRETMTADVAYTGPLCQD